MGAIAADTRPGLPAHRPNAVAAAAAAPTDSSVYPLRASWSPKRQRKRAGDVPEHRRRRHARAGHG